jgi:hypothetical protein
MSDDDTTRIIHRKSAPVVNTRLIEPLDDPGSRDDDHTRIYRPRSATSSATDSSSAIRESQGNEFSAEPLVGWLVVTEGPGRGQSLKLGYGVNSIGRCPEARVALDFGDEEISRQSHAMLTYDTIGRKFYIQHGGGTNLTYLGDQPVLQPHEIKGREVIGIGKTRLTFIPFCGADFEWTN